MQLALVTMGFSTSEQGQGVLDDIERSFQLYFDQGREGWYYHPAVFIAVVVLLHVGVYLWWRYQRRHTAHNYGDPGRVTPSDPRRHGFRVTLDRMMQMKFISKHTQQIGVAKLHDLSEGGCAIVYDAGLMPGDTARFALEINPDERLDLCGTIRSQETLPAGETQYHVAFMHLAKTAQDKLYRFVQRQQVQQR